MSQLTQPKTAVGIGQENARRRAYRLADETGETVTDEFEEWSDENIEWIREQVRSKPMYAVGLSLLAGAIVGAESCHDCEDSRFGA